MIGSMIKPNDAGSGTAALKAIAEGELSGTQ
jgi:hypothetical protein